MFARPYAPTERTQPMVSPRMAGAKHFQLFRTITDAQAVPQTPVLQRRYDAPTTPNAAAVSASPMAADSLASGVAAAAYPFPPRPASARAYQSPFSPSSSARFAASAALAASAAASAAATPRTGANGSHETSSPAFAPSSSFHFAASQVASTAPGTPAAAAALGPCSPFAPPTIGRPPHAAIDPTTGLAVPSSAGTPRPTRPSTASSSSGSSMRHLEKGVQAYQAVFLSALDHRQKVEADRLTLFNRLAHLRDLEEKAERQVALTQQQIAKVARARARHEAEAARRLIVETAAAEARTAATQEARMHHRARREAFQEHKRAMVLVKKEQSRAQRSVQEELLAHRQYMATEQLAFHRAVRDDIHDRARWFQQRLHDRKVAELERAAQEKAWKIQHEEARRVQAEIDLAEMQREEEQLIQRAQETRREHEQSIQVLAGMVLKERKLPTARARYESLQVMQGKVCRRRDTGSKKPAEEAATTVEGGRFDADPSSGGGLLLSMPSSHTHERIHIPHRSGVAANSSAQRQPQQVEMVRQGDGQQEEEKENDGAHDEDDDEAAHRARDDDGSEEDQPPRRLHSRTGSFSVVTIDRPLDGEEGRDEPVDDPRPRQ